MLRTRRNVRLLLGSALVMSLTTTAGVMAATGVAQAKALTETNCAISGTTTISPGLNNTPTVQTVTSSGTLSGCGGTGGQSGGTFSSSYTTKAETCSSLGKKATDHATESVTWSPSGNTSSAAITLKFKALSTTVALSGKVTSGFLKGDKIKGSITFTLVGSCPTLTSATFTGTSSTT